MAEDPTAAEVMAAADTAATDDKEGTEDNSEEETNDLLESGTTEEDTRIRPLPTGQRFVHIWSWTSKPVFEKQARERFSSQNQDRLLDRVS